MWNLLKKFLQNNFQDTSNSRKRIIKRPFYIDGKWALEVTCTPEYSISKDDMVGGCGATYVITEDELDAEACLWRSNALFGWSCKECGKYHVLTDCMIPENIKDKVFYRKHPEKLAEIVNFNNYKKRKGKD